MAEGHFHYRAADGTAYHPNHPGSSGAQQQWTYPEPPEHPEMYTWEPGQQMPKYEPGGSPPARPGREKSGRRRGKTWGVYEGPPEAPDAPPANDPEGMYKWELKQARLSRPERKKREREEANLAKERCQLADEFHARKWMANDYVEFCRKENHAMFERFRRYMTSQHFYYCQKNREAEWLQVFLLHRAEMDKCVANWRCWVAVVNRYWRNEARRCQKLDAKLSRKQAAAFNEAERMRREQYEEERRVERKWLPVRRRMEEKRLAERRAAREEARERRRRRHERQERKRWEQQQRYREQRDPHYQEDEEEEEEEEEEQEEGDPHYEQEEVRFKPERPPTPALTVDDFENFVTPGWTVDDDYENLVRPAWTVDDDFERFRRQ